MHIHDHGELFVHCEHEMKWCKECCLAYCEKCGMECRLQQWPIPFAPYVPIYPQPFYVIPSTGDPIPGEYPKITC